MAKIRKLTKKKGGVRFQPGTTRGLRSVRIRSGSFDPNERTFEFVLASETPCLTYRIDQRWNAVEVDEVLPMAGLVGLETFRGAPLLDTHSSWSVRDVLGRITTLRVEGTELIASAFLSQRDDVAGVAKDIETGVLQEFSVGWDLVEDGEPEDQETSDRPLIRVKSWSVREGSLVPIPDGSTAVIRSARSGVRSPVQPQKQGSRAVDAEELKTALTAIFTTATNSIVELMTDDEGGDEADLEAEAEAAAEAAREAVLAKKKTPATSAAQEPARSAKAGEMTAAARAAAVLRLRTSAKRNGRAEDFADMEASGASLEELRQVAIAAVQTSDVEINTASGTRSDGVKKVIRMKDTPAGKRTAGAAK